MPFESLQRSDRNAAPIRRSQKNSDADREVSTSEESKPMDKDRIKGKVKQIEGELQKAKGKLTHSKSDKIVGEAKVVEGKVEEQYGKAKDAVRKASK